MKSELEQFLTTDLQFIKGVGPVLAAKFDAVLGGRRILDFLLHAPTAVRPREIISSIVNVKPGDTITINVRIVSHKPGGKFRNGGVRPTQIICNDEFGATLTVQFFGTSFLEQFLQKFPIGQTRIISGRLEFNNYSGAVINHPDFIEMPENAGRIPRVQAIYPSGEGLSQKVFANVRDGIFDKLGTINNDFFTALRAVHYPESGEDLAPESDAIQKLAYWELLAHQVAIVQSRKKRQEKKEKKQIRPKKYDLMDKFYAGLPFELTTAQKRTIAEIFHDMAGDVPMMRLVQGDVGSGKTIVAMGATVRMAEFGAQTVLMAPTDTLAVQHFAKLKPVCDELGLHCEILTGRDKGRARNEKLISLKSGRTKLAIGTHALFSDDVEYKDLGLVIIDEQHRFGVTQRETMRAKGKNVDLLALSATPIPRTLSMTIYGDMDISIINEKPAGRLAIKTTKLDAHRVDALIARLRPQIDSGAKVFWVCPLVTENEELDMMAAEQRYEYFRGSFPNVGLVHGQMDKKKRDAVMAEFANPESGMQILVSTTVIEVGIDVPSATIMVIENASRFGLSALHQLRGRVGRGNAQSFCILMFDNNITENGMKRLDVLCETDDGFIIAEQDLIMRGTGELLGTRQSGWINYRFVDYRAHRDLFKLASRDARDMVDMDEFTRDMMFIFGRETELKV